MNKAGKDYTMTMNRRFFTLTLAASTTSLMSCGHNKTTAFTTRHKGETDVPTSSSNVDWANLPESEWKERLTDMEFHVLRKEGTERPFTSPLNDEKREGVFVCRGCEQPLFRSDQKFDSGTGWPSFFDIISPEAIETKTDRKLFLQRTEYHCSRCGGHHGHVFKDGPAPTGLRYCNNGVALKFIPKPA